MKKISKLFITTGMLVLSSNVFSQDTDTKQERLARMIAEKGSIFNQSTEQRVEVIVNEGKYHIIIDKKDSVILTENQITSSTPPAGKYKINTTKTSGANVYLIKVTENSVNVGSTTITIAKPKLTSENLQTKAEKARGSAVPIYDKY
jgi:hypothetical protein